MPVISNRNLTLADQASRIDSTGKTLTIVEALNQFNPIMADAPFVDSRSLLTIYRTSRGNWYDGLCLYVLVQGIIYFALSLTASCIYTIPDRKSVV